MTVTQTYPADLRLSVVIPVLAGEECWKALLVDLVHFPQTTEFLFVSNGIEPTEFQEQLERHHLSERGHWFQAERGRAIQMNHGAAQAQGLHLLFLHADSRLSEQSIQACVHALTAFPERLHYFDLRFVDQSFSLMRLNAWGVYFRSHVLGMPFGDQGLCLSRELFCELKGFDETAAYGEDHLLVWNARRNGVRLRCVGAAIETSARKYREWGWFRMTCQHLWLTVLQAIPQCYLLLKERFLSWLPGKAQSPSS